MRLLLTTDTVGGVWTFTRELTSGLLAEEHAVALVSFGRSPSPGQQLWAEHTAASHPSGQFLYRPSAAPLEWMEENEHARSAAEPLLLETIASFRPDLLHLSQFCFGALATPEPRLITAHSDVLSWAAACRPQGLAPSPWLSRYLDLVSHGLARADAVVSPTAASLDDLRRHWPTLPPAQHVIHNGRTLSPSPAGPRHLQAITAGRLWDEAKQLSTLQELHSPLLIRIAGEFAPTSDATPSDQNSLHFLGTLDEANLLSEFRQSAIYIAPSIYEPFGLAPLEAALCGCALVLRDLPSFREIWQDSAFFFSSVPELQAQLARLAAEPDLLRSQQRLALARAHAFSRQGMVSRYTELYRSLLSAPETIAPEAACHVA